MAVRSKTIGRVGTVLIFLCLTFLLLSFASDKWVESSGRDNTGFENLGLWSVCFKDYYPPVSALVNRKYDGCWWVLNKELDDLRNFLIPPWYESTQILVTISLVLVLMVCILLVINLINCFPHSPHRHTIKRYLALASSALLLITATLLTVAIILFGVKSSNTGSSWLQQNDENSLSWSYGMCILADFLAMLTAAVLLLQYYRHRAEKGDSSQEPKVFLTNEPPPRTNYQYSRNNNSINTARPVPDSNNPREPAYVQRYHQAEDSRASLISGPTDMFAVSGRGEVYVNNMATYDQQYQDQPGSNPQARRPEPRVPMQRNPNAQSASTAPRSVATRQLGRQGYPLRLQEPSFIKGGSQDGSVDNIRDEKSSKHASLPEYVPKQKKNETASEEDSFIESESDNNSVAVKSKSRNKKRSKDNDVDSEKGGSKRKSRSRSKTDNMDSRERSRSRSNSRSHRKSKVDADSDGGTPSQRRRSKKRHGKSSKAESSEDEGSVTRRRSRRNKRSKTRSRSRSKDRMTSDSQLDSDTASVHSRSRRKRKDKEFSRMDSKRRSASEDNLSVRSGKRHSKSRSRSKKRYDGNVSDDFSGSEYSQKRSKRKVGGRQSDGDSKSRSRDFSDSESVKSRSKRSGDKPKMSYSSYYEY